MKRKLTILAEKSSSSGEPQQLAFDELLHFTVSLYHVIVCIVAHLSHRTLDFVDDLLISNQRSLQINSISLS